MSKEYNYYYNPYLPIDREGKGEMMSMLRAMLLLCITILLSVGAILFSNYTRDRFEIVPLKDGVFIFDRQSSASNFCNDSKCIVLSSEFLLPKKILVSEIPGVSVKTQIQPQNSATPQVAPTPESQNIVPPRFNQSTPPVSNNNPGQNFGAIPQNFDNQNMQNNQQNFDNDQNQNFDQNQGNFQN